MLTAHVAVQHRGTYVAVVGKIIWILKKITSKVCARIMMTLLVRCHRNQI